MMGAANAQGGEDVSDNPEKPNPLWWRVGKGKWHGDPLLYTGGEPEPLGADAVLALLEGNHPLISLCAFATDEDDGPRPQDIDVQTRRTAPPVADQCKRCRAAKATARKGEVT